MIKYLRENYKSNMVYTKQQHKQQQNWQCYIAQRRRRISVSNKCTALANMLVQIIKRIYTALPLLYYALFYGIIRCSILV